MSPSGGREEPTGTCDDDDYCPRHCAREEDAINTWFVSGNAGANLEATTVLDSFTPLRTAPRQGQSEVLTVRTRGCGQGASSWQADPTRPCRNRRGTLTFLRTWWRIKGIREWYMSSRSMGSRVVAVKPAGCVLSELPPRASRWKLWVFYAA